MTATSTIPRSAPGGAPPLSRLIYSSHATQPFDGGKLADLVRGSRAANGAVGVTGVLIYDDAAFLQVLEGPETAVADLADRISSDPRHEDFDVLSSQRGVRRAFVGWNMHLALRGPGGVAESLHPLHPPGALFSAMHDAPERLPDLLGTLRKGADSKGALRTDLGDDLPGQLAARLLVAARGLPEATRLDALLGGAAAGITAIARRIETAARALGALWLEDRCTGADLATALCALQGALRRFDLPGRVARASAPVDQGHLAVAPAPGEKHILGAVLKTDLLRAAGWHVTMHFPTSAQALADILGRVRPDGLVIATSRALPRGDRLDRLAAAIAEARRAVRRPGFFVAVGGLDFARGLPAAAVGADIACRLASDIVETVAGFARPARAV